MLLSFLIKNKPITKGKSLDKYDPKINSSPKREEILVGWELSLKKYSIKAKTISKTKVMIKVK